jgi:hypothetical protein
MNFLEMHPARSPFRESRRDIIQMYPASILLDFRPRFFGPVLARLNPLPHCWIEPPGLRGARRLKPLPGCC